MAISEAAVRRLPGERPAEAGFDAEDESFSVFYRRYYPRLFALCRRRVTQDALAEDIAQETLLRALVHKDAFDPSRPAWPWLKTIATNLIVDHFRKQIRETPYSPDETGETVENPPLEEADLLRRAIARLPRRQRAAVALRYLNDWDANDAARFMGLTKPAYDQLLFRARRRLRVEYQRLAEHVSGGVLAGSAWLRAMSRRTTARLRSAAIDGSPWGDLASVTVSQLATGTLAFVLTLGGVQAPEQRAVASEVVEAGRAPGTKTTRPISAPRAHQRVASAARPAAAIGGGGATTSVANADAPTENESRSVWERMSSEDVDQPEDARITSVALSTDFSDEGTGYAAGRPFCPADACPAALFKTTDGGATWARLAAQGFQGGVLLVPPGGGDKFFAMGPLGLQVTEDGGDTFGAAAPAVAGHAVGSAAISPAFDAGDPTILIGAQTLMRYRDDLGMVEPSASTTGPGPLEPVFSPQYPADSRVVVGSLHENTKTAGRSAAVHVCRETMCSATIVGDEAIVPRVRLAPDFVSSNRAFAFTSRSIYRSLDGAGSFEEVRLGWEDGLVNDLALTAGRTLVAAVDGRGAGVYLSSDDGRTWSRASSPLFEEGATVATTTGDTIVVALKGSGLACSRDAGLTWSTRCGA